MWMQVLDINAMKCMKVISFVMVRSLCACKTKWMCFIADFWTLPHKNIYGTVKEKIPYSSNLKKMLSSSLNLYKLYLKHKALFGGEGSIVTKYLVFILCKISTDRILFVLFCFFCLLLGGLVSFVFVSKWLWRVGVCTTSSSEHTKSNQSPPQACAGCLYWIPKWIPPSGMLSFLLLWAWLLVSKWRKVWSCFGIYDKEVL